MLLYSDILLTATLMILSLLMSTMDNSCYALVKEGGYFSDLL